jgi:hypothetical protein
MSDISKRIQIAGEGYHRHLTIQGFRYSPVSIMIHLERLDGLKFVSKWSWYLTDDFDAVFKYKGYAFRLWTPFAEVEIMRIDKGVPETVVNEIFNHVKAYKIVWFHKRLIKGVRYVFLPFQTKN